MRLHTHSLKQKKIFSLDKKAAHIDHTRNFPPDSTISCLALCKLYNCHVDHHGSQTCFGVAFLLKGGKLRVWSMCAAFYPKRRLFLFEWLCIQSQINGSPIWTCLKNIGLLSRWLNGHQKRQVDQSKIKSHCFRMYKVPILHFLWKRKLKFKWISPHCVFCMYFNIRIHPGQISKKCIKCMNEQRVCVTY